MKNEKQKMVEKSQEFEETVYVCLVGKVILLKFSEMFFFIRAPWDGGVLSRTLVTETTYLE